jgi:hypothetical protein
MPLASWTFVPRSFPTLPCALPRWASDFVVGPRGDTEGASPLLGGERAPLRVQRASVVSCGHDVFSSHTCFMVASSILRADIFFDGGIWCAIFPTAATT